MTDLLLVNGTIRTMDPAHPVARSIACAEGRVESLDERPAARRTIDLKGKTVVPGFVDAHVHLLQYGRMKRELDLTGVSSYEEVARRVAERASQRPKGSWIYGAGHELPAHPHHAALTSAVPDHAVWLVRRDGHSGLANAAAMARADLSAAPVKAKETGVFLEHEMLLIERLVPQESPASAFLLAQKEALQLGITAVHDAQVDDDYLRLLRSLDEGRSLRLRVHAMVWNEQADRVIEFMRSTRPVTGARLSVRAIKLFMDGSLGSSTAWMLDPFHAPAGAGRGVPLLTAADVERIGRAALETGWQVCAHAIGDRANRELLDAYERLDVPAEARWRIEHAQHLHRDDLPRSRRWIASVQPAHCLADRAMVEERLGPERFEGTHAWKKLGRLALGTDAPVDRLDPRWTFTCAVTRGGWRPEERLGPEEALRGMTADAAWAGFMDGGVLAPGRPADMAVLSHDWLAIPPEEVPGTEILATLMDGKVAFQSRGFGA